MRSGVGLAGGDRGTLGEKTFKPGRYVVIARAVDSGDQRSDRVTARFRITSP